MQDRSLAPRDCYGNVFLISPWPLREPSNIYMLVARMIGPADPHQETRMTARDTACASCGRETR